MPKVYFSVAEPHHVDAAPDPAPRRQDEAAAAPAPTPSPWHMKGTIRKSIHVGAAPAPSRQMILLLAAPATAPQH
jgi:hypothetical protein